MARTNKTRFALLGMLSFHPASGYEIKTAMQRTTDHFWSESDGAIYPILKQLLDEGLVTFEVENADSGKPKKVYSITEDGNAELQDWLEQDVESTRGRSELLLKIFFGKNIDKSVTKKHIENYKNKMMSTLKEYENIAKISATKKSKDNLFGFLTLKAGIIQAKAKLQWCDEALELLK